MADGWLADRATLGEVTGTHRSRRRCERPQDGDADRIGDRLQELHVRIFALHVVTISKLVNIDLDLWTREASPRPAHVDACAPIRHLLELPPAVGGSHDLVGDRKAQACAASLFARAVKSVEDARPLVLGDAGA